LSATDVVSQRTVPLSEKPQLGAQLFALYEVRPDVFPDMENLSFERSIFKRLQGLNLRDSDMFPSNLHLLERHWTEESGREIALDLHKALAKDALNCNMDQTDLAAIVLPLSRSCLQERLHLAIGDAKLRKSSSSDHNAIAWNNADKDSEFLTEHTTHVYREDNDTNALGIGYQRVWDHSNCFGDVKMRSIQILMQDLRRVDVKTKSELTPNPVMAHSSTTAKWVSSRFQKKYALRFGTAPLWYLQSMATGPPSHHSSPQY